MKQQHLQGSFLAQGLLVVFLFENCRVLESIAGFPLGWEDFAVVFQIFVVTNKQQSRGEQMSLYNQAVNQWTAFYIV